MLLGFFKKPAAWWIFLSKYVDRFTVHLKLDCASTVLATVTIKIV